jgi:hypothetical protein
LQNQAGKLELEARRIDRLFYRQPFSKPYLFDIEIAIDIIDFILQGGVFFLV